MPISDNQAWTSEFGMTVGGGIDEDWHPWFADRPGAGSQVAGYVTYYKNNFAFATVSRAGHMVPEFDPISA